MQHSGLLLTIKMNLLIRILCSAFLILNSAATLNAQPESAAIQSYYDELKSRNYNPEVAPEGNNGHGSPIHVYATMFLLDVHKIDDSSMDYRASFYFRQVWNDTRLAFPDLDISSIIMDNTDSIWTPDLFFAQQKEGVHHSIITPNVFVRIQPDGEVKYSIRVSVTFSCPMDFRKYPHDTQKCLFQVESYGRNREELTLDWDPRIKEPVSKTAEINVLPFELIAIENSARDVSLSVGNYRALEITLTFKRKIGFFMTRLYIPFILLVALSWLSFWIKCKMITLRISLLLVIMYLMINISSDISSYIPPAPYTKASDVWIAVCQSLVFAAFLEFIFVSILSRTEKKFDKKRSSDAEAPIIGDMDEKEKCAHSETMSSAIRKVASRLSREKKISNRVDTMASILFPLLFLIFNFLYWLIY